MNLIETTRMALDSIWSNRLRSFLTLVGIIAGVASIIAVMTGVSVVQTTMEKELSVLGSTTFQAQKWPARGGFNNDIDWRAIQRRRPLTVAQANAIREQGTLVDLVGAELWKFGLKGVYRDKSTNNNVTICGGTPEYAPNNTHLVEFGRNISPGDVKVKRKVAIIGPAIARQLFPYSDPVGRTFKLDGHKYKIIGVLEEKRSAMGGGYDNYCIVPISVFLDIYGMREGNRERSVNITVRALSPELVPDAVEEVRSILRRERKVNPRDPDDFEIFTNNSQIRSFNQATAGLKMGSFVIGIIALVVAGIGIMNIMLVSVTERTREIGIRKSLGANRKTILGQFLLEAIILCNIGGIFGVMIGFGLGNIMTFFTGFQVTIPLEWAIAGLMFCTTVGLAFGIWPATRASKLDPIEALRFE